MASRERIWLLHLLAVQPCESLLPSLFLVCKVRIAMAPTSMHSPGTEPGAQWALNAKKPPLRNLGWILLTPGHFITKYHHQVSSPGTRQASKPSPLYFPAEKDACAWFSGLVYKVTGQFEPRFSVSKRHPSQGRRGSFHVGVLGGRGARGWTHWGDRPPALQGQIHAWLQRPRHQGSRTPSPGNQPVSQEAERPKPSFFFLAEKGI